MNNIGFPNTDIYSEHEQAGGESFWPSFTDIMMVIVMVFLMITVAVILNNWELINNLKASVDAEKLAMAKAQSALQSVEVKSKENETLGERLARLENLLSLRTQDLQLARQQQQQTSQSLQKREQEVVAAQATINTLEQQSTEQNALLTRVQLMVDQQTKHVTSLEQDKQSLVQEKQALEQEKQALQQAQVESASAKDSLQKELELQKQQVATLQKENEKSITVSQQVQEELASASKALESKSKELEQLRQKDTEGNEQLLSLQGEFAKLDKKYQKLLRPARSERNKHVVRVVYSSNNNYQLGDQGNDLVTLSRVKLDQRLTELKAQHGDNLYVKIIIPASSNVSHADAWRFTSEMLTNYDYYHADDAEGKEGSREEGSGEGGSVGGSVGRE